MNSMSEDIAVGPSRDQIRANEHNRMLEQKEIEERYGVAPSLFSHFGLFPLTAPDEASPMWTRENAFGAVTITRGVSVDERGKPTLTRYPSGGLPRLFLVDLATEVLDAQRRGEEHPEVIDLGRTLNRYTTERLGLRMGSQNRAVLGQITATARATITLTGIGTDERTGRRKAIAWDAPKVADKYELWLPEQDSLAGFEPSITLSAAFVNLVLEGQRIPVRRDLLAQLAGKPMAFDVLLWLGSVTYSLYRSGRPDVFFDWPYLYGTFTHEYGTLNNFTIKWKSALTEALRYYTDCSVEIVKGARGRPGGIRVRRSPLLIEPRKGD